ncbi:MAG: hypothetical protein D6689_19845 [Deltaproteobacteria bacterium]|nr:MAG: hypothetical protein D6689_19845 [Deltaproteobacteria bacterium]
MARGAMMRRSPGAALYTVDPGQAKRDERLRQSGKLVGFEYFDQRFPLQPTTFFYDWLYATAVSADRSLLAQLCRYEAFTDIEFNPKKSLNCQARSAALCVALARQRALPAALNSPEEFRKQVWENHRVQQNLF